MTERACPICGKPADPAFRPFCSRRCRELDLSRWLTGRYAIPAAEDESEVEGDAPPAEPDVD
jgi:endogenous inhibitor of DNA gyrase (YacG/DUF329 family)